MILAFLAVSLLLCVGVAVRVHAVPDLGAGRKQSMAVSSVSISYAGIYCDYMVHTSKHCTSHQSLAMRKACCGVDRNGYVKHARRGNARTDCSFASAHHLPGVDAFGVQANFAHRAPQDSADPAALLADDTAQALHVVAQRAAGEHLALALAGLAQALNPVAEDVGGGAAGQSCCPGRTSLPETGLLQSSRLHPPVERCCACTGWMLRAAARRPPRPDSMLWCCRSPAGFAAPCRFYCALMVRAGGSGMTLS